MEMGSAGEGGQQKSQCSHSPLFSLKRQPGGLGANTACGAEHTRRGWGTGGTASPSSRELFIETSRDWSRSVPFRSVPFRRGGYQLAGYTDWGQAGTHLQ